jgi:hypothetical protein
MKIENINSKRSDKLRGTTRLFFELTTSTSTAPTAPTTPITPPTTTSTSTAF